MNSRLTIAANPFNGIMLHNCLRTTKSHLRLNQNYANAVNFA